jgi:TonB family protein
MPFSILSIWAARLLEVLGDALVRSTVLALVCLLMSFLLRRRTAALRHLLWHGVLLTLLLLPVLSLVLPPLRRPALVVTRTAQEIVAGGANRGAPAGAVPAFTPGTRFGDSFDSSRTAMVILVLAGLYLAGVVALLFRLAAGLYRLHRLSARSQGILDADLREQIHSIWLADLWSVKPRVLESAEVSVPLTLGLSEPVVILPCSWRQWDRVKREAVLIHELAHAGRNDTRTLALASLATCLYWFHPLAWILKRHLALLAEQSCDEQVVRSLDCERYAGILVDIARDLQHGGRRFLAPAVAAPMVKTSQMKSRLERILSRTPSLETGSRFLRIALLACLPPLAYLSAAGHLEQQIIEENPQLASHPVAPAEDVAELEAHLARDPANQEVHEKLLYIYHDQWRTGDPLAGEKHDTDLLWLIANHPESNALGPHVFCLGVSCASSDIAQPTNDRPGASQPHHQEARDLWMNQLAKSLDSPAVLAHAGAFFREEDGPRALDLYKQARQLDPKEVGYVRAVAWFYEQAEWQSRIPPDVLDPAFAEGLREELTSSNDAALLAAVGSGLVPRSYSRALHPAETDLATLAKQLMDRALALDPANPQLQKTIEAAQIPPPNAKALGAPREAHRIGAGVMELSLITKVDPVYPPLAKVAGIQGNVVFDVLIDKDGSIESAQLSSGHPLLANAARKALFQYRYVPTLLRGNPVPVVTTVTIKFHLPSGSN